MLLKNPILPRIFWLLFAVFGVVAASFGQATYGSIIGTVTDSTGAVVDNAQIKALNTGTKVSSTTQTNPSGNYRLTQLLAGTYYVTFSKQGASFRKM